MENARVAVFVKNLTSGGAEKQAVLLANALHEAGVPVSLVVFNGEHIHGNMRDLLDKDVPLRSFSGKLRDRFRQFKELLADEKINVVFSYLTAANAIAVAAAPRGVRVVTGLRCNKLSWHKHLIDAVCTRLAARTVSNSISAQKHFTSSGFPRRKVEVIHNYITPIPPYQAHEPGEAVDIVSVGRYVPEKDLGTAIDAFAIAAKGDTPLHLTLVGYGPEEAALRKRAKQAGVEDKVEFVINPPNVADYERRADIYLSTSTHEGLSNSIMEAMNVDLPVISTRAGDSAVLVKDGDNGIIVEMGDTWAISDAIAMLANDPDRRARMGFRSKQLLKEGFDRETFTRRYLDLLKRL